MNGNNGHRHRLDVLEAVLEPPTEGDAEQWRAAWDSALHALLATMAPEHVQGLGEEMAVREHPDPSRPYGRLWAEVHARLVERVGAAPGVPPRYPTAPLALPAALADVYLAGTPNLRAVPCPTCGLRLPAAGELVPVVGKGDSWWYADTHEPAPTPALPDITGERVMWRELILLGACPVCPVPMSIVDGVMKDDQRGRSVA